MSTVEVKRQRQRRGTTAQATAHNEVLGPGEIGVERDGGGLVVGVKFGDGNTAWLDLPYVTDAALAAALAYTDAETVRAIAQELLKIPLAQRGVANGVATLDSGGLVPSAQLPSIAISDYLGDAANQAAMLAFVGQRGDWCTRSDLPISTWIVVAEPASVLGNWKQINTPADAVSSVNGHTGAVTGMYEAGGTDVAVADGGTGASTAAGARTSLGLVIGTDIQAFDADTAAIAALVSAANKLPYATGVGAWALADLTAYARTLLAGADAPALRALLGASPTPLAPSGQWVTTGTSTSTTTFANGVARIFPLGLPPCSIDRLGFEVTVVGGAGALTRVCAWFDNNGVPGLLAADGGQIATDVGATVKNATVAITHPGGRLWVAAINQVGAPTATLRYISASNEQVVTAAQPTTETGLVWVSTIAAAPGDNPAGSYLAGSLPPRVSVRIA
jgi:hypothetical protein